MVDEFSLGKELEEKQQKESTIEIEKAVKEPTDSEPSTDGKSIALMLVIILGVFALGIAGFKLYDNFATGASVVDVDKLHQENLAGDLDEKEGYMYNGFSFVYADGLWWTEVNRFETLLKIPLHYGPKDVENLSFHGSLTKDFDKGDQVYLAIDPEVVDKYYTLAISELSFNVVKGINRVPVGSCTKDNPACDNRTIVSCDNTQGKPVIELALSDKAEVKMEGTCIKISGREYELVKAVDRVLLKWYGVMQ